MDSNDTKEQEPQKEMNPNEQVFWLRTQGRVSQAELRKELGWETRTQILPVVESGELPVAPEFVRTVREAVSRIRARRIAPDEPARDAKDAGAATDSGRD